MQLGLKKLRAFWSFSARRWDLIEPWRNSPLFRKDLSQAVTYHKRNYTHGTKQTQRQGLQRMHMCTANCSCVLYNILTTRWDIYTLHESLPFLYGKSTMKYVHMEKTASFSIRFKKSLWVWLRCSQRFPFFLALLSLDYCDYVKKNPIAAIKKVKIYIRTAKTFSLLIKNSWSCTFLLNMYRQGTAEVWTLPCGKGEEQSSQTDNHTWLI